MPNCVQCGADRPPAAKFCAECGAAQATTCTNCGTAVTGKFCAECGTPVAGDHPRQAPSPPRVSERRITSVLFGDLVGFTTLSESRDPEEVRELLSRYFDTCRTVIARYGGTVEKFIGDAVMAVWGVPIAQEDDAERAVRAGLDIVAAVIALGEELGAPGLSMRVGIVTGEVAVTLGASGEGMVAGDAVNTAARVQSAARPGEVWVDRQTKALTVASVAYADAGSHELKGKTEALELYVAQQVVAIVGGSRRVDGLEAPFVGRDRDLRMVKEIYHATLEEGRPRLLAVVGAAGVGKSRLGWEFDKYSDGITNLVAWHRGRCLAYGEGVAFWALAEMLRMRLGSVEGETPESLVDRLRDQLPTHVEEAEEREWLLPRLATLLGVAHLVDAGTKFPRDDLFAAWQLFFERLATTTEGCVLVVEDVQWADDGLLDFFERVVETSQAAIFILAFARPELAERRPRWGSTRRTHVLHLEPLSDAAMNDLVDGLVDGLPATTRQQLVARAEGLPLYAVETVRALIDKDAVVPREGRYVLAEDASSRVDFVELAAPTSLHNLIAARLDALPERERRLVQDASVLGQSFTRAGIAALVATSGLAAEEVDGLLSALVRKEILSVEADPRSPERGQYRFVQALVRTVAYETLSRRDRKTRHLAAVRRLESEPDADVFPAVLASHYLDARDAMPDDPDADELAELAMSLLERAGARARELGAPAEARRHYETAYALATTEADLGRLAEGAADSASLAGDVDDAISLADRACEHYLAAALPVEAGRVVALWGAVQINAGSTEAPSARLAATYDEVVGLPRAEPVAAELALQMARCLYMSGPPTQETLLWFDRAVTLAESVEDFPLLVRAMSSYGGALMIAGRPTMGLGVLQVALDLTKRLGLPQARLSPLNNLVAFLIPRDLAAARGYADEAIPLMRRTGDRSIEAFLVPNMLFSQWLSGDWDAALAFWRDMHGDRAYTLPELSPLTAIALIQSARGEPLELPPLDEMQPDVDAPYLLCSYLVLSALERRNLGDHVGAAVKAIEACDRFVAIAGMDDDFYLSWVLAVELAIAGGALAEARRLVDLVADAPPGKRSAYLRAQLPRLQAELALVTGESADINDLLTRATAALRDFGAVFDLARALLVHAEWLAERGEADRAQPLLDEAQQIFADLRARPWLDRALGAQTLVVS
ncbi:MAG TPA: adenylate/guanylate cyclase domain-containing protein [Mycobacteriales bacterium]|jgi:class 3 adenylate cyclase/tetratricopeptide (TPR) repeat protein|nr:adenylate/guanylate cyclase domain-containing protein [Mycobacteriales bacterium]